MSRAHFIFGAPLQCVRRASASFRHPGKALGKRDICSESHGDVCQSGNIFQSSKNESSSICLWTPSWADGWLLSSQTNRRKTLAKKANNNFLFIMFYYHGSHDSHGSHGSHRGSHGSLARRLVRPYSPHRRFFVLHAPLPPGISSLFSYIASKNLAFKTPLPLGISNDLPWGGYGWFLELHNMLCFRE